jgi:hypothetical protein
MTFTAAVTTGVGLGLGLIGAQLLFLLLVGIAFGLYVYFRKPKAPEHAVDTNVPDHWNDLDIPAYIRRDSE